MSDSTSIAGYSNYPLKEIESLQASQYAQSLSRRLHPIEHRLHLLKKLGYVIQDNRDRIAESVMQDLGRSAEETELGETISSLKEIELAVKRLPEWMADESCKRDTPLLFKFNNPKVRKQPKGPALIIGPWNYPWLLNLGPLVGAIAAGCPAVIKPSEHSPHCSALLARLVNEELADPAYHVVLGEVEQSKALLSKRWGHIFFTGAPSIGRQVAVEAAKNLVPCTMELGGKCPVIIAKDANLKLTARRLLSMKTLGSGQMCTNTDYILCPKELAEDLMKEFEDAMEYFFPANSPRDPLHSPNVSKMVNRRGFDRAVASLDQLRQQGKRIIGGQTDGEQNKMGVAVVMMSENAKGDSGTVMEEEIFGPILPIIPIDDIDTAIDYVNARNHPLALYVFSSKKATYDYVIDRTLSGGSCWNDCTIQTLQRGMPFGGVGESGYGAGHGKDFFDTFTHRRSMIEVPYHLEPVISLRYPAATMSRIHFMFRLMGPKLTFGRSTSPASEKRKGLLRRLSPWALLAAVALFVSRRFT